MKTTEIYSTTPTTNIRHWGPGLWSGIIAGFFIALLTFWIISYLGIAIGGHTAAAVALDELDSVGIGASIWLLVASIAACFLGAYFCSRIASYASWKAGIAEGLVVSSTFFMFLALTSGMGLAVVGQGVAKTAGLAAGASGPMLARAEVQTVIGNALSGLSLKSDPSTVVTRVGTDLLQGNTQGARNYLAFQTGLSGSELDARLRTLQASIIQAGEEIKSKAGTTLAMMGWFAFLATLLGTIGACVGAAVGARQNVTSPLRMWATAPVSDVA